MKSFLIFNIALILIFDRCNSISTNDKGKKQQAILLNNKALIIYTHNLFNKDSLNKAVKFIDSALSIYKNINFYYNKYSILRRLGEPKLAINVCDSILMLNSHEFRATLYKGFLYEDLNLKDSEVVYYNEALKLMDSPKSFNGDDILKDRERLIIIGLLKDTLAFRTKFYEFRNKYSKSNNSLFPVYITELQNFDREKYLSDY
jgi:tetratricopeptide (TPR) repeat protein